MPKRTVGRFGGLNTRTLKGSLDRLEFQQLQNVRLERNGNLRSVKAHDFVHESTNRNEGVYVEEDGTVRELTFASEKSYTNKPTFVKLSRREVLYNDPADDISQKAKILKDGADQADTIKNSSFPSYGIPYNENVKIIQDGSGNFYTVELNLELIERIGGRQPSDSKTLRFNCYDSAIAISVRKYNGFDFKSQITQKIFAPTKSKEDRVYISAKTSGKSRYKRNASFPVFWLSGEENSQLAFTQQYLNWDVCLSNDENTLIIGALSTSHLYYYSLQNSVDGDDPDYNKIQEVLKLIQIDVSGDNIQEDAVFTVVNKLSSQSSHSTLKADFTQGFGIAHNGTNTYVKGLRWSYKVNTQDGTASTAVDSAFSLAGSSTLFDAGTGSTVYAYMEEDGIYPVLSDMTLGSEYINTETKSVSENDLLLTKRGVRISGKDYAYLFVPDDNGVYTLNLTDGTISASPDTTEDQFPLYYNSGWTGYNNVLEEVQGNIDELINQTIINNRNYDGFSYVQDDINNLLDTTSDAYVDFEEMFTANVKEGGKPHQFDFKKVVFLAIGVRFNDNLYTPPLNYAMALVDEDEQTPVQIQVLKGEIAGKVGSSDSFDDVNEVYLFGNNADYLDDYYFSSSIEMNGKTVISLRYKGLAEQGNYGDVMGIKHGDGFDIYYRAVTNVGGRTFAIGAKTDSQTLDTLSQILYYTDGHPSGLNPQSEYIFLSDIINPVGIVGVQQKCLVIGEDDIGFAFNSVENIHKAKGTVNFNAIATNGDVGFYLHREGVMMVDQYRVVNISEAVIDPEVFLGMSDTEFKECSGAIHGEYGLYILSDPSNKKIYCFDIASCYATFSNGQAPFVFETKFDLTGTTGWTDFQGVYKLQTFYNKVYGKVFATAGTDAWLTVELFRETSGEASHSWQPSGITNAYPFDNRNQIVIRSSEIMLPVRPKSIEIHYKSDAEVTVDTYKTFQGSEENSNTGTLPVSASLSNHKKQWLKNMKNDHFSFRLVANATDFELEQVDINE